MENPITQPDLSQITKNRHFLPVTIAISALIAGIIAITIIIAVVKHKQKLKNNPKQTHSSDTDSQTSDTVTGNNKESHDLRSNLPEDQSTENSISDDEDDETPQFVQKSTLNTGSNDQFDQFAGMYANDETFKRILEESKQTATAQNLNTNQQQAQEIDEKTKQEQEKKKQEEANRQILFESAKAVVKQKKEIPINENIKQFVENNDLKFLISKNDDCVADEFCESFTIQLVLNGIFVSSKLQNSTYQNFLRNFSKFFEDNKFGYAEYKNKFEGDYKVKLADEVTEETEYEDIEGNKVKGYATTIKAKSPEVLKTVTPNNLKFDNLNNVTKTYIMENGKKQYVIIIDQPKMIRNVVSDELIEYDAGTPAFTIKNIDPQISKILRNTFNDQSKVVKIGKIEAIDVTSEIIRILSIVSHIRNSEPNKKFDHLDSNEYKFTEQSV